MSETKEINSRHDQYLLTALVKEEKDFDELVTFVKGYDLVIVKTENLGEQHLNFPINKNHSLILVSIFFTAENNVIPKLNKELRTEEYVQRFLLTSWKADPDAPKRASGFRSPREAKEVTREVVEPVMAAAATEGEDVQS